MFATLHETLEGGEIELALLYVAAVAEGAFFGKDGLNVVEIADRFLAIQCNDLDGINTRWLFGVVSEHSGGQDHDEIRQKRATHRHHSGTMSAKRNHRRRRAKPGRG
jgi:hypothetical protein